jgi:hypothetical protein
LTLFSAALSAPVLTSLDDAANATKLLDEQGVLVPVFLAEPLGEFVISGSLSVCDDIAYTYLLGRRTRQVQLILNPALVKTERSRIEKEISGIRLRNGEIDSRLDEIRPDGDLVCRALNARSAISKDSENLLFDAKQRLAILQKKIIESRRKASNVALNSIPAMVEHLSLGSDRAREVLENETLPNLTIQARLLDDALADLECKTTEEATLALINAKAFKKEGGELAYAELRNERENASALAAALVAKQEKVQQGIHLRLQPAFERAQNAMNDFMHDFRSNREQLCLGIDFEAQGHHIFMERASETGGILDTELEIAQERLKIDFRRAHRFIERASQKVIDYATQLALAEAKRKHASEELNDAQEQIRKLTERISLLRTFAEDLHDVALAIREQYAKLATLTDDLRRRLITFPISDSTLQSEISEVRMGFVGVCPNTTAEFSRRLRNLAHEIRRIALDTPGLRSAGRARENAGKEFTSKRDEFCEKARNNEIKGLHRLEIDRIAEATTLEELEAIRVLKTGIEQRITEEVRQLEDKRAVMESRKEAGIDSMVSFARRAEFNLKTLNEVMARSPQARFFVETAVADEARVRQIVEWLISQIEDKERALSQRTHGVVLNDSIAKRNSSYTDLIKNSLTKQLFIDPRVYFAHAGIWNGKKCPIVDDKLSMGQKTALHLMWMIKQAEFNLARAVKNFSTSKDRRLAAQRAQRVIIFDGLFSNLSDEKLINDAFEGLKYVGGNFQLIGLMHNPRYVNNPDIFPTYLVGERFRKSDDPIDRGFIAIEPWQEGGKMAIFSSYFKRNNRKINAKESHA